MDESVFIIGGWTGASKSSTIAKFKHGSWTNVGNLTQARHAHGAILSGSTMIIVGGTPELS